MSEQCPTIGRIVHYTLSEQDAEAINARHAEAEDRARRESESRDRVIDGNQRHVGNHVEAGDVYPMIITRVWGDQPDSHVNGQVFLDGNDTLWATSVSLGAGERHFVWPPRI